MVATEDYKLQELEELINSIVMVRCTREDVLISVFNWSFGFPGGLLERFFDLSIVLDDTTNDQVYETKAFIDALNRLDSCNLVRFLVPHL